jgi:hypothetical protein
MAVSAAAVLGVALLAGCSSSSSSSSSAASGAASAGASAAASAQMLPPVIIEEAATTATCKVGDNLDIIVAEDKLAGTTVSTDKPDLLQLSQGGQDGDATFNPGGKCVAAGSANITVTNPDNTTRDIAVTITE